MQLVVATDTLIDGVHFPRDTAPADIGWKALAVNLSDLAAMGATPAWCTLALSLPRADAAWLDALLDGFLALADAARRRAGRRRHHARAADDLRHRARLRDRRRGVASRSARASATTSGSPARSATRPAGAGAMRARGACRRARRCARAWTGRRRASRSAWRCAASRTPASMFPTACSPISAMSARERRRRAARARRAAGIADAALRCSTPRRGARCRLAGGDDYELCFTAAADAARRHRTRSAPRAASR